MKAGASRVRKKAESADPASWIQDCFILYQVGQEGAAGVYKAIQASLRRLVLLKVIRNSEHRRPLENEALRASQLNHENIATLYAADFRVIRLRSDVVLRFYVLR